MLWRPDTLRPLVDQLIPVAETMCKEQLKAEARKISRAAVDLVESKGGWNPLAVTALKEGGAATAAKYLNHTGVSAEYAPEVQLGVALASILAGHLMLLTDLRRMAQERKQSIDVETVRQETVPHELKKTNSSGYDPNETRVA